MLTACLHALAGNGVHVLTANDYLAARDADWMGPVYSFLGFRRTLVTGDDKPAERRELYAADVVYGTANAFAYDYLRDNMVHTRADVVQRGHFSAIVDEADLVMLDAAALLPQISGPADVTPDYAGPAAFVVRLQRGAHYTVDEARRAVSLTEAGMAVVEAWHGGAVDAAFFLSFEDPHLRLPGPAANVDVIETDGPILSRVVRRAVAAKLTALSTVEISRLTYNLRYAAVREEQRATLYTRRADILNNGLTRDQVDGIIADVMRSLVLDARTGPQDVDRLSSALADHYPSTISRDTIAAGLAGNSTSKTRADLVEAVVRDAHAAAAARESELGAEVAAALAQRVMLSVMDRRWRAQLQDLQDAEESPSLRGLGVDGALAAYQRTAERLAVEMWEKIDTEFVGYWFNLEVTVG